MRILKIFILCYLCHSNYCSGQDTSQSKTHHNINVESCGLFKIESGININPINSFNGYFGYGILTMLDTDKNYHFLLGTAGIKAKTLEGQLHWMPQLTLDFTVIEWRLYSKINIWCPIKSQEIDVIVTPQIGYAFALGLGYVTIGYDINTTNRLNFQNSLNLNIGINLPTNLSKMIEKM